jgi:hypothetical protein
VRTWAIALLLGAGIVGFGGAVAPSAEAGAAVAPRETARETVYLSLSGLH